MDPRTKMLLMLLINVTIFGGSTPYIMLTMAAIPIFLLFVSGKNKAAIYCLIAYSAAALSNYFLVAATQGILNIFVVMISGMLYRIMPAFIMGYYLVMTTTVSEIIAAMECMRVPNQIIIPMSVMFRFFPTIAEEAKAIRDAMEMRGLSFWGGRYLNNPLAMLEYRLVPLLMSTVKIGEELSAAALTRGLGSPVKRTNICKIGFSIWDIVLSVTGIGGFLGFIFL
ncbi:MAG: energy-coupling factor transporter transmembrane component T [Thermotaleaceae bacterium]